MKIGLYFGSFNPIHIGHLIIANYILNKTLVEKLWFVVSPQNPFKAEKSLLNEFDRLHLVRLAIDDDARMKASDIEFYLPKPSYTVDTMTYLQEKYPEDEFSIIMGSDSFKNINKWKNSTVLLDNFQILVYKRPGFDVESTEEYRVNILDAPLFEISSTQIRELIRNDKSIRYLVPEKVREELEKSRYYK